MKTLNLRLDDELHAKLRELADRDHRSMNQQIVWLLERGLEASEPIVKFSYRYDSEGNQR